MYVALKHLHMTLALLSIIGFIFRGLLKLQGSALLQKKLLRIAPHVIDTLLLASAIGLVVQLGSWQAWLSAKVLGLFLYIGLGLIALRFAQTQTTRVIAFVLAILTFAYIFAVARSHSVLPFIG